MGIKESKKFFQIWDNGTKIHQLHKDLCSEIFQFKPKSIFDFGAGNGKILNYYKENFDSQCRFHGCDISKPAVDIAKKLGLNIVLGDEKYLDNISNKEFDMVITCSVLDHIPEPEFDRVMKNLIRIGKNLCILETVSKTGPNPYYFPHDYESYGFTKLEYSGDDFGDGNVYHIWRM